MWALAGERTPPIRLTVAVVPAVAATGGTASAVGAPEHVIKYRRNLTKGAGAHVANVVVPAQGRVDFADALVTDSGAIVDPLGKGGVAFPEGDTRARAKIWEEHARFDAAMEESPGTVRGLAAAARAGDLAAVNAVPVPVARGLPFPPPVVPCPEPAGFIASGPIGRCAPVPRDGLAPSRDALPSIPCAGPARTRENRVTRTNPGGGDGRPVAGVDELEEVVEHQAGTA